MGICYELIMEDDCIGFNEDKLKEFEIKFDRYIERIAQWDRFVVYNIEKAFPYAEERLKLISQYCDRAYVTNDHSSGIEELKLPSLYKEEIDRMAARRTPEEKKASEDLVREKLKRMKI
jgi:hypothetical protein